MAGPRTTEPSVIRNTLCNRIIEHHGGGISLDPTYTEETRICFTLPDIDAAEPGAAAQDKADGNDTAGAGASTSTSDSTEGILA